MRSGVWWLCGIAVVLMAGRAWAADPAEFTKDTKIVTVLVGGGQNVDLPPKGERTDVSFINGSARLSYFPLDPLGSGALRGISEVGLEPFVQLYLEPYKASAQGLKAVYRFHFLAAAPLVPYLEFAAGALYSNLRIGEIRSKQSFSLEGGLGLSYLVANNFALTGGYRFQHISNASTESPDVGINSNTGVVGFSVFFK